MKVREGLKKLLFVIFLAISSKNIHSHAPHGLEYILAVGALIPSEFGYESTETVPIFIWGWDWQIPLKLPDEKGSIRHKLPISLINTSEGRSYSIGYRYTNKYFLGGVNYKYFDTHRFNPEVGLRICIEEEFGCLNFIYGFDSDLVKDQTNTHSITTVLSVF